ncbi:hypothetical protein ACOSQ2_008238 [Xanthoceras sorbifolium]
MGARSTNTWQKQLMESMEPIHGGILDLHLHYLRERPFFFISKWIIIIVDPDNIANLFPLREICDHVIDTT